MLYLRLGHFVQRARPNDYSRTEIAGGESFDQMAAEIGPTDERLGHAAPSGIVSSAICRLRALSNRR
jgi:hypothetical protein